MNSCFAILASFFMDVPKLSVTLWKIMRINMYVDQRINELIILTSRLIQFWCEIDVWIFLNNYFKRKFPTRFKRWRDQNEIQIWISVNNYFISWFFHNTTFDNLTSNPVIQHLLSSNPSTNHFSGPRKKPYTNVIFGNTNHLVPMVIE